jgi:hypothetical protein
MFASVNQGVAIISGLELWGFSQSLPHMPVLWRGFGPGDLRTFKSWDPLTGTLSL